MASVAWANRDKKLNKAIRQLFDAHLLWEHKQTIKVVVKTSTFFGATHIPFFGTEEEATWKIMPKICMKIGMEIEACRHRKAFAAYCAKQRKKQDTDAKRKVSK